MNEDVKNCPYCGEVILASAKKCKHCGEWLDKNFAKSRSKSPKEIDCLPKWKWRLLSNVLWVFQS